MSKPADQARASEATPHCYFGGTLFWLRWTILVSLLLLTLVHPIEGRAGLPLWALILIFAGYNLFVEMFQYHLSRFRAVPWVPILDLPVATAVYFLGPTPNGPIFVLFLLITGCAATCMTFHGSLQGYRPIIWSEGHDAFEMIVQEQPDLVILDLWLEHPKAGEMVLGLMRVDPMTKHLPVIVCTTDPRLVEQNAALLQDQYCDVLVKPFGLGQLQVKIEQMRRRVQLEAEQRYCL